MEFRNIFVRITLCIVVMVSTSLTINGAQAGTKALQAIRALMPSVAESYAAAAVAAEAGTTQAAGQGFKVFLPSAATEASLVAASASTGTFMAGAGYILGIPKDDKGRPILTTAAFNAVLNTTLSARDRIINFLQPEQPLLKLPPVPTATDLATTPAVIAASPLAAPAIIPQATADLPQEIQSSFSIMNNIIINDKTLALAAVAGAIALSRYMFQPTEEIVNEALKTWEALYKDPLIYFFNSNNKNLEQIKSLFLKALGIQEHLLNVNTYLQKKSDSGSIASFLYNEREDVEKFLEEAEKAGYIRQNEFNSRVNKILFYNIRLTLIKIYGHLLKIKSTFVREKEKEYKFIYLDDYNRKLSKLTSDNFDKTNINSLDKLILKISSYGDYKPSDPIKEKFKSASEVYEIILSYYENPRWFYPREEAETPRGIERIKQRINEQEGEVIQKLFGGYWYNTFVEYTMRNVKISNYLEAEKAAFISFYEKLRSIFDPNKVPVNDDDIKNYAKYLDFLILRGLSIDQKVSIVQDFLQQTDSILLETAREEVRLDEEPLLPIVPLEQENLQPELLPQPNMLQQVIQPLEQEELDLLL